jgi:hypothetical protein
MKIIQDVISIAAAGTNSNVLSGKTFERVPSGIFALLSLAETGAGVVGDMFRAFNVGGSIALERGGISILNRIPLKSQDMVADEIAAGEGDLLQLTVENTSAGALNYFYCVGIEEIDPQEIMA